MAIIKTEALVLRTIPFQDSSCIVKLFTKEQGKISVIAKGARRLKSNLRGYLEPLNYIEAIYYYKATRDIQTLSKVDLLRALFINTTDIESSIFGLAVLELIDRVVHDHQHDAEVFDFSVQTLETMDRYSDNCRVLFIHFIISIAGILGYRFETDYCSRCKNRLSAAIYDSGTGQLVCQSCGSYLSSPYKLTASDLQFLNNLHKSSLETAINPMTLPASPDRIIYILLAYLAYHIDSPLNLKSLSILSELSP
ncbi:MAG TPA: DNA repair protein RecO [Candidatus Marinimicrobia bacterium]|nr:DNA repair protein RecO [Candidatus Neomarinimicrobiota bacterium]